MVRSTAGAILAIGFGQNGRDATILDGNVRRVLARYFALTGYLDEGKTVCKLWQLAESLTPLKRAGNLRSGDDGSWGFGLYAQVSKLQ